jgi:hypothetical protein
MQQRWRLKLGLGGGAGSCNVAALPPLAFAGGRGSLCTCERRGAVTEQRKKRKKRVHKAEEAEAVSHHVPERRQERGRHVACMTTSRRGASDVMSRPRVTHRRMAMVP